MENGHGGTEAGAQIAHANGRSYRRPRKPVAVICFDGCDPTYIEHGLEVGLLPAISRVI